MQWLSGRVLDSRPRGRGIEPHRCHCVVSLSKNINPSFILVQSRKTRPFITGRLLMGRKESNQTKKIYILLYTVSGCDYFDRTSSSNYIRSSTDEISLFRDPNLYNEYTILGNIRVYSDRQLNSDSDFKYWTKK